MKTGFKDRLFFFNSSPQMVNFEFGFVANSSELLTSCDIPEKVQSFFIPHLHMDKFKYN
ncbi:hypothetical protein PCURB6_04990 [Paenibacillus curdlanolyticus]|nr:hypothetical protein PCURB6_04990 [Paenibacillus curdlanolyticus]